MGDLAADKVSTNMVIKVYETKALAEEGDGKNALFVFDNGEGATSATTDPLVSNGSQYISGTSDGSANTSTHIEDADAQFGSRLAGKKVTYNGVTTTISTVDADGKGLNVAAITGWSSWQSKFYHIHNPGEFFIFKKYYYRFEATDPVKGFIIDWDDGEDNSAEKANRQTINLDTPRYYAVVSHTYTKHGKFFPMVRTISPEGFYSKWYVSSDALSELSSIESQTLSAGQNDYSTVSLDISQSTNTLNRLPEFAPANMPPIGVLKTDRTSIFSGIDNTPIPTYVASSVEPKGYCHIDSTTRTVAFTNGIEVIYRTTLDKTIKETVTAHTTQSSATAFPSTATDGFLKEILSVKIVNMKETTSDGNTLAADERVNVRVFDSNASGGGGSVGGEIDSIITTVSLGNPIQYTNRPGFSVNVDGGQSQTRASNVSINKYWFETGKLLGTIRQEAAIWNISDCFGVSVDTAGTAKMDQTSDSLNISYTFDNNEGAKVHSSTKRFNDEERLVRLQVEDSSASTRLDGTSYYSGGDTIAGKTVSTDLGTTGTVATITSGHGLNMNDVIKLGSGSELLKVIAVTGATSITLQRGFQDTSAEDHDGSVTPLAVALVKDNGQQGDTLTKSFIEHWDRGSYIDDLNRPDSIKSRSLLLYANAATIDVASQMTETWSERAAHNATNSGTTITNGDTAGTGSGDNWLVFGGTASGTSDLNRAQLTGAADGHNLNPGNYILACKDEKFNRVYINVKNTEQIKCNLTVWYTAATSPTSSTYHWKPIPIVDTTSTGEDDSSLRHPGSIIFDMPDDWVSIKASDIEQTGSDWYGPCSYEGGIANYAHGGDYPQDPKSLWTENMYGLLIGLAVDGTNVGKMTSIKGYSVIPYNNTHSQIIQMVDPHHKSLNDMAFAQGISWNRSGKYAEITDRLGRSEIRKIGAEGGQVTFGGVELKGSYATNKGALLKYQREGTPIYLDVEKKNSDFVRIYGVISSLSEDYPTGMHLPKFGLSLKVEYIAEFDSTGAWVSNGLMALGGEIIDEPKYVL